MASLTEFIERRLRLRINEDKSAVARPEDRHFLGFRLRLDPQTGTVEVLLSERTMRNAMDRVRQLTPRTWGGTLDSCIARSTRGCGAGMQFFGIARASEMQMLRKLDAHIRRRLRAILLRHWQRKRTIVRNLIALVSSGGQRGAGSTRATRSWWALSHSYAVDKHSAPGTSPTAGSCCVVHCTTADTRTSPPPSSPNWCSGNESRSITGRRRGSQPAVPRSRVRRAQARFCGSRGRGNRPGYPTGDRRARPSGGGLTVRGCLVLALLFSRSSPSSGP